MRAPSKAHGWGSSTFTSRTDPTPVVHSPRGDRDPDPGVRAFAHDVPPRPGVHRRRAARIVSPDDTYSDLQQRCEDYLRMGVQAIWIIDPTTRSGRMCTAAEWLAAERLEVPGTPIHVELAPLFAQLHSQALPDTQQ